MCVHVMCVHVMCVSVYVCVRTDVLGPGAGVRWLLGEPSTRGGIVWVGKVSWRRHRGSWS